MSLYNHSSFIGIQGSLIFINPLYSEISLISDGIEFTTIPNTLDSWLSEDGTFMYYSSNSATDRIYYAILSTPNDLSTAVASGYHSLYSGTLSNFRCFNFSSDGYKLIVSYSNGDTKLAIFNLTTPFDVSSATSRILSTVSGMVGDRMLTIHLSDDGLSIIGGGYSPDSISVLTLGSPYDITNIVNVENYTSVPSGIRASRFTQNGTIFITAGSGIVTVFELSTPYDWETATQISSISGLNLNDSLTVSSDGSKMYLGGYSSNYIRQYSVTKPLPLT